MSAPTGIHLILPSALASVANADHLAGEIDHLLQVAPITSVELVPTDGETESQDRAGSEVWSRCLSILGSVIQARDAAFLLNLSVPDLSIAERLPGFVYRDCRLDGITVSRTDAVAPARAMVGPTDIVAYRAPGVGDPNASQRHNAMVAGEDGADVVVFPIPDGPGPLMEAALENVRWWAEMMELPCIAHIPPTPGMATAARQAGADFIGLDQRLWGTGNSPSNGMTSLTEISRHLDIG